MSFKTGLTPSRKSFYLIHTRTTENLYLKLGRDWDNSSGLRTITNCVPVLAVSGWFWLNKFRIGKMGAELPVMTSRHRHICNLSRLCAKRNLRRKNLTIWSYLWQQYATVSLPLVKACFLSDCRDCLVTWNAKCFAIINLAPPIATLRHGKTAGSGERCLKTAAATITTTAVATKSWQL